MQWFIARTNGDTRQHAIIDGSPINIGRVPQCSIVLNEKHVSRRHLLIQLIDGIPYAVDLHSNNGTEINGKRRNLQIVQLQNGDEIKIGNFTLVISSKSDDPEAGRQTVVDEPSNDDADTEDSIDV